MVLQNSLITSAILPAAYRPNLTIFFEYLCECTLYNTMILFFDNESKWEAEAILENRFLSNHKLFIVNIDNNNMTAHKNYFRLSFSQTKSLESFLIVFLFKNGLSNNMHYFLRFNELSDRCNVIKIKYGKNDYSDKDDPILNANNKYKQFSNQIYVKLLNSGIMKIYAYEMYNVIRLQPIDFSNVIMRREVRSNRLFKILFFDKCDNLNRQRIEVAVMNEPPRIIVIRQNQINSIGGIQGCFCQFLSTTLNAPVSIKMINDTTIKNMPRVIEFHKYVVHTPYDIVENKSVTHVFNSAIRPIANTINIYLKRERFHGLYSHNIEYYVIVVPAITKTTITGSFIELFHRSPIINLWTIVICLYALARKLVRIMWDTKNNISDILINTIGLSFGTVNGNSINCTERVLNLFLSLFTIVAGCLCSGYFFQQFVIVEHQFSIQKITDLSQYSKTITVLIPDIFEDDKINLDIE